MTGWIFGDMRQARMEAGRPPEARFDWVWRERWGAPARETTRRAGADGVACGGGGEEIVVRGPGWCRERFDGGRSRTPARSPQGYDG